MAESEHLEAVGYVRVSTSEQGVSGLGLDAQGRTIGEEAARRGWVVETIYREVASGAKRARRPQLEAAIEHVRQLDAGVLMVSRMDRLARSTIRYAEIVQRMQAEGWTLVIVNQPELDTSSGRFNANIQQAVAEFESDLISERTRAALAVLRSRGVRLGRPPLVSDDVTRRATSLRRRGLSYEQVAAHLNSEELRAPTGGAWTRASARRVALRGERLEAASEQLLEPSTR